LINVPDFILTLLGIYLIPKKIRVQPYILLDENGVPVAERDDVKNALDLAREVFQEMNVRLVTPGPEAIVDSKPAPIQVLEPDCDETLGASFSSSGSWFRRQSSQSLLGVFIGYGAQLTAFAVRDVTGSAAGTGGCHKWFMYDYLVYESTETWQSEAIRLRLAHEIGHCCDLGERNKEDNLMEQGSARGRELTNWQKAVFRSSRYVTYTSPF
jgi:hypothetical protein